MEILCDSIKNSYAAKISLTTICINEFLFKTMKGSILS